MNHAPHPDCPALAHRHQRGAALLMAMVIVTVVATLASSMVWQQWRSVQVESAERGRAQSQWILTGILDFSQEVLRQDGQRDPGSNPRAADTLSAEWAKPLQESRISTFLSIDKDNTDDAPDAFMSIKGTDLDSRYNLRNLLVASKVPTQSGAIQVDSAQLAALKELFLYTRVPELTQDLADNIAKGLEKATQAALSNSQGAFSAIGNQSGLAGAPVMPQTMDQLVWLPGLDAALVNKLRPFVTLIPYVAGAPPATININTAPKEVIAAVWGIDPNVAENMVQRRAQQKNRGFANVADAQALVPTVQAPAEITVFSDYFEVTSRLRLGDSVMQQRNILHRTVQSRTQVSVEVLHQERVSGVDPGP